MIQAEQSEKVSACKSRKVRNYIIWDAQNYTKQHLSEFPSGTNHAPADPELSSLPHSALHDILSYKCRCQ